MPVEFTCDGCSRRLRAPDAKAGKRVNCPSCGKDLQIPVMSTPSPLSIPSAGAPTAPHNPLDQLAATIPTAAEAAAAFTLSRPGGPAGIPPMAPPSVSAGAPKAGAPNTAPTPTTSKPAPAMEIDIGLAPDASETSTSVLPTAAGASGSASGLSQAGSGSSINGGSKSKVNAWRGAQPNSPATPAPAAVPRPATSTGSPVPGLSLPMAGAPAHAPLSLPMAGSHAAAPKAPVSPLVPVAPMPPTASYAAAAPANPLDDIFKDIPQLAPIATTDPFATAGNALPSIAAPRWDQVASSANVGSRNPYASPSGGASGGFRGQANISAVRTIVMIPAIVLLTCYVILVGAGIFQFGISTLAAMAVMGSTGDSEQSARAMGGFFGSIVSLGLSLIGLVGAIKMLRMKSHSSAMTASILAIFPFCFCLPIGIWAVVVLSMSDVKRAFAANDR